ncbi:hypothetical protein BT93_L4032 [Corymbia citriodora subsp. variegata]|uniref:Uncharacterized protein n=1 Tax=Corymbia citriodora subsp. variegata TaxID=360336 RepID=A0A8T0CGK7_CORYI|nr:hypothetical protein BT93_L4032 [Corymbia citriodora subsp. variegata]
MYLRRAWRGGKRSAAGGKARRRPGRRRRGASWPLAAATARRWPPWRWMLPPFGKLPEQTVASQQWCGAPLSVYLSLSLSPRRSSCFL